MWAACRLGLRCWRWGGDRREQASPRGRVRECRPSALGRRCLNFCHEGGAFSRKRTESGEIRLLLGKALCTFLRVVPFDSGFPIMIFFLAGFGLLLHIFIWGAGLSLLITPRAWLRHAWLFAPACGLALQSAVRVCRRCGRRFAWWRRLCWLSNYARAGLSASA